MSSVPPELRQALLQLVRANHILHHHGLVDAFGHISIRHPLNDQHYVLAAYDPGAPALVKSFQDFIIYHVEGSAPVDPNSPQGYSERFIHGEIYSHMPNVNCVVHSHSETVIPFTVGGVDVKPVFHMAGFLGPGPCAVFKAPASSEEGRKPAPDMLIRNEELGYSLAQSFKPGGPVVLQHKHGFTTYGNSVQQAVYRAVYTQSNCKLLAQAIIFAGGDARRVEYLTPEQVRACAAMNEKCEDKSWRLWIREVQVNPLYVSEEGEPDAVKVAGMNV